MTGTSSGIGRCIATNLLQAGVNVVGLDKKESQIDDPSYVHISQDLHPSTLISNSDHLLAAFEQADGLVNCAAITKPLPDSLDEKYLLFRETIAINLESIYILCELFYNSSISFGKKEALLLSSQVSLRHEDFRNPSYIRLKQLLRD